MIEHWLQISCDHPECAETENSHSPNETVTEFLSYISLMGPWIKVKRKHFCSQQCADDFKAQPNPA
jgi:hypothetical protein